MDAQEYLNMKIELLNSQTLLQNKIDLKMAITPQLETAQMLKRNTSS